MGARRGPQGRGVAGGNLSVMEMLVGSCEPRKATRFVMAIVAAVMAADVGATIGLYRLVGGGGGYSFRRRANDLVGLALARAALLPSLSALAHAAWWAQASPTTRSEIPLLHSGYALLEEKEALAKRKARADFFRDLVLAVLFVASSAFESYIGVKLCVFEFDTQLVPAIMGSTAALVAVEAWVLSNLVHLRTKVLEARTGVHKHPLALSPCGNNWCDVCDRRILDAVLWRCARCNYDVCLRCYDRASRASLDSGRPSEVESLDQETASAVPPPPSTRLPDESEMTSWEICTRTSAYMRSDWAYVAVALFCVTASGAASLALPNFQGAIIDAVYQRDRRQFRRRLLLYLAFSIGAAVTSSLRAMCFQITGRRLSCTLRNALFAAIVRQDVAFFDNNATGTLTSRLTQDINQMSMPLTTLVGTLLSAVIQLCGSVAMAFYTSWRLSMLAFTTLGPVIFITNSYATWSKEQNRRILSLLGEANSVATESLGNIRTVKAMGADADEIARYETHTTAARDRGVVDAALSASTQLVNNFLDRGAGWLILFYGGVLAMRDGSGLSAGRLVTYQLYFNNIQSSYNTLISLLSSFTRASGAAQRVLGVLGALPIVDPDAGKPLPRPPSGSLEFDDVFFAYEARPERLVLRGFTLRVPAGSTVALVGKSGSGKTTALSLALRFYDPQAGRILLDGAPLHELKVRDYRSHCSIVAQTTELFDATIAANIKYGVRGDVPDASVTTAARAALADEFIVEFPNGYDTRIGERGVKISGGQRQRISIARAFLRDPKLLFLDEATSALDAESEAKVQQSLDALIARGSCSVLLVAHRLSTVRNADAIAVLSEGSIVELGSHEDLMQIPDGIYAALVNRQLEASANALEE